MIQRIQTVYLFLVVVISVIFMTGSIITYRSSDGQVAEVHFTGVSSAAGTTPITGKEEMIPLAVLSFLIPIFAAVSLILFRNRRIQIRFTIITLSIDILLILVAAFYYFYLARGGAKEIMLSLRTTIPIISMILIILAVRGIRKDEKLVKSYDRLR